MITASSIVALNVLLKYTERFLSYTIALHLSQVNKILFWRNCCLHLILRIFYYRLLVDAIVIKFDCKQIEMDL